VNENTRRRLKEMAQMTLDGLYGEEAMKGTREIGDDPTGLRAAQWFLGDFKSSEDTEEIFQFKSILWQTFLYTFKETKKKNPSIADSFVLSLINDFPQYPNSNLLPRWESYIQASIAFRQVAKSNNFLQIWNLGKSHFLLYNEFIDGLLGFLIICWQQIMSKQIKPGIFKANYGTKIDNFNQLTDGENEIFSVLTRISRPKIRNAIAHGKISIFREEGVIRYLEKNSSCEQKIDTSEFFLLCYMGSHLGQSYVAFLLSVIVLESGIAKEIDKLPTQIIELFFK
jgi:hypothetical protein